MSRTVRVKVPGESARAYEVHIARGLLSRLGELVRRSTAAHACVVIADQDVARLYGDATIEVLTLAGLSPALLLVAPGEAGKSPATWAELSEGLLEKGIGRDGLVVALGGGVTGDVAGFVASTFMRGIPHVVVPTSLLAMVDSSIGGKTAVNLGSSKNTVGTFHHPRLVVVDPDLLDTLPDVHRRAGLAEAVKTAIVLDAELFGWIERRIADRGTLDRDDMVRLIAACVALKARVVEADPGETGMRQVLNFGHTVGHALEALAGFDLLHGEAVAAGMRVEAHLGEAMGVTGSGTAARLEACLDLCGLRVDRGGKRSVSPGEPLTPRRLRTAAHADKKVRRGELRAVLLERVGSVARDGAGSWTHPVDDDSLAAALDAAFPATSDVRDSAS